MRRLLRRPSPAMGVAPLALFVSLGGVSYGVATSSIGTRAIKDGSVQSRDIRDAAVRGRDVKNGTLLSRDVQQVQTATASDAVTPKAAPPAQCPKGRKLLGGGAHVVAPAPVPVALYDSGRSGNAWTAAAYATAPTGNRQLVSVAICG